MKTIKEQFKALERNILLDIDIAGGDVVYVVKHHYKTGYKVVRLIVTDKYLNYSNSYVAISAREEGEEESYNYVLSQLFKSKDEATAEMERQKLELALKTIRNADVTIAKAKLDKVKAEQVAELLCTK